VELTTARLRLRRMARSDASFVLALLNEPSFIRYIGDRNVRTTEAAVDYIENGPWSRPGGADMGLRVVELLDGGDAIGICGLLKRDTLEAPDIGFAFLPAYWSHGYAAEAATAVLRHARDSLGHLRILAIVSPGNAASIRLLEKLGLRQERLARLTDGGAEVAIYGTPSDTIPPS
jgi:ribosomal-protein-alanine N-acetyltransferase